MPAKTSHQAPSIAELASALEISGRRVSQLKVQGMPVSSIATARQWRTDQAKPADTAEQLRIERISLVKVQREKITIQNAIASGEVIPRGQVQESVTRIVSVARSQLLKLASDVPPKLAGLNEAEMQTILRDEVIEILTTLSTELSYE